jgi:membrane-associated phospholipid phosphatase
MSFLGKMMMRGLGKVVMRRNSYSNKMEIKPPHTILTNCTKYLHISSTSSGQILLIVKLIWRRLKQFPKFLIHKERGTLMVKKINLNRRQFLFRSGVTGLGALGAVSVGAFAQPPRGGRGGRGGNNPQLVSETPGELTIESLEERAEMAFQIRTDAAQMELDQPLVQHTNNGDETFHPEKIGNFSKTLPHNQLGEVDPQAYAALTAALVSGSNRDFERIPQSGSLKLANPQAAFAYDLLGPDPYQLSMPAAPNLTSPETAGEMVEVYWHALLRDVNFNEYGNSSLVGQATRELSGLTDFRGPASGGSVTSGTLFRGNTPGDLIGPYISQFLFQPVPYGVQQIEQRNQTTAAGTNHMINYDNWLGVQNGNVSENTQYDATPRFIRNGRDLGEYVHKDYPGQAFFNAALILLNQGASFDTNNPYLNSNTQEGFVTFNITQILKLVSGVVSCALKHAWFHKWLVNRRVRPEAFGGLVHNHLTGQKGAIVHNDILLSGAAETAFEQNGSYLLPLAYPEGSPTHPSYPAGHATLSGACATVLKAFFNEDYVLPNTVVPSSDGVNLESYSGTALTVKGEVNKLAANISLGRDFAGVHYRSDGIQGLALGEAMAMGILAEMRLTFHESFNGFSFTKFDGTTVTV